MRAAVDAVFSLLGLGVVGLAVWLFFNDYSIWQVLGAFIGGVFITLALRSSVDGKLQFIEEEKARKGRAWGAAVAATERASEGEDLIFEVTCLKPDCSGRIKERAGADGSAYRPYTYRGRLTAARQFCTAGGVYCTSCGSSYLCTFFGGPGNPAPGGRDAQGKIALQEHGRDEYHWFDAVNKPAGVDRDYKRPDQAQSLSPEIRQQRDALIQELISVGRSSSYLRSPRTREIGERLFNLGGHEMMLSAHRIASNAVGGSSARELEVAWDSIGEWAG